MIDYLSEINTEIMNKVLIECIENGKKNPIIPDEFKCDSILSPHTELTDVEMS